MMYNIQRNLNNLLPLEIGMLVRKVKIFTDGCLWGYFLIKILRNSNFKLTLFQVSCSIIKHYLHICPHSVFPHFRFLTNQCKWQMNIFCAHKYFIGNICAAAGSKTSRRARSELTEIDSRMFGAEEVTFTSAICTRAGNTNFRENFNIAEKDPTRACSQLKLLKAPSSFTFTLRNCAIKFQKNTWSNIKVLKYSSIQVSKFIILQCNKMILFYYYYYLVTM